MAEKNKTNFTPFEKEKIDTAKKILEYKLASEANIVSIFYKNPELLYETNLTIDDFTNNTWKVYFEIAYSIVVEEKKNILDDITVGLYLDKHPKLKAKYNEAGGYNVIQSATTYVKEENLDGYVLELKKWNAVLQLCKLGFPVKDQLSQFADMSTEEIYNVLEMKLNHIFINTEHEVKSYNVFEGIHEFIDELNEGRQNGLDLYNAPYLTEEIGGFNYNGNIYGLGAGSGVGKSTMVFNYLVPSVLKNNMKIIFIINEEDEKKFKKEMLIWVANNIFKKELNKKRLREGHFTKEILELLKKCADWIEERKEEKTFIVIPLESYSVNEAIKIIKKYSSLGYKLFVLDTLKESCDAKTDEIYKSMMRDMVKLYDVVKPSAKNVGLFVTYQLGKGSLKLRHLTNNEIGQAKSIIDVMSVNIMMRRPFDDEYFGESKALQPYRFDTDAYGRRSKINFDLKPEDNPMIIFILKNRFGETNTKQIVASCDLGTNTYSELGYCHVPQDF